MSRITEIPAQELARWDETVRSFADYDVFYLNEYVVAFMQEHKENGVPVLLYYENGEDRAINVVFKRDIADDTKLAGKLEQGKYYDLISPYGYGGFFGTVSDYDALNRTYNAYCTERGYVCEFVRFELFTDYHRFYDGQVESRTHNVVRDLSMSMEDMWMDFKQKVRKNVKHARACGLEIVVENTGEHLDDFLRIYYATMDRDNAAGSYYFSRQYYETLNSMQDNIMYFHAMHEGKVVSTELVLYGSKHAYSYLGGTDGDHFDLRPNDFLKYEIIRWAKEKGLETFVLGGGFGSDDGIFRYKASLAPRGIVDFYIGRKIFDPESYAQLVKLRAQENPDCVSSGYFPQYRA